MANESNYYIDKQNINGRFYYINSNYGIVQIEEDIHRIKILENELAFSNPELLVPVDISYLLWYVPIFKNVDNKIFFMYQSHDEETINALYIRYRGYRYSFSNNSKSLVFDILPNVELDLPESMLERLGNRVYSDFRRIDYRKYTPSFAGSKRCYEPIKEVIAVSSNLTGDKISETSMYYVKNKDLISKLLFGAKMPAIKKVIFNEPATIIYWNDNSKTVVKASKSETFSKETGLAYAIANKYFETMGFESPRGTFKKVVKNAFDMTEKTKEKKALKALKAAEEDDV